MKALVIFLALFSALGFVLSVKRVQRKLLEPTATNDTGASCSNGSALPNSEDQQLPPPIPEDQQTNLSSQWDETRPVVLIDLTESPSPPSISPVSPIPLNETEGDRSVTPPLDQTAAGTSNFSSPTGISPERKKRLVTLHSPVLHPDKGLHLTLIPSPIEYTGGDFPSTSLFDSYAANREGARLWFAHTLQSASESSGLEEEGREEEDFSSSQKVDGEWDWGASQDSQEIVSLLSPEGSESNFQLSTPIQQRQVTESPISSNKIGENQQEVSQELSADSKQTGDSNESQEEGSQELVQNSQICSTEQRRIELTDDQIEFYSLAYDRDLYTINGEFYQQLSCSLIVPFDRNTEPLLCCPFWQLQMLWGSG